MKLLDVPKAPAWLKIHPKNGFYYIDLYRQQYGRLTRTTKEKDSKQRAQMIGEKLIAEWMGQDGVWSKAQKPTFAEAGERMRQVASRSNRASTQKKIERVLRIHLYPHFGTKTVDLITESHWSDYVAHKRREAPDATLWEPAKYFTKTMNWAYREGLLKRQLKVKSPDEKKEVGVVITEQEFSSLLDVAQEKAQLILRLGYECGMRLGEITNLSWDRMDIRTGVVTLRPIDTKTKSARKFPVSAKCLEGLKAQFLISGRTPWVFPQEDDPTKCMVNFQKTFERIKARAEKQGKLKRHVRFHDTRHSFLSRKLLVDGVNPALVSKYAGVSLTTIYKVYLHTTVDQLRGVI